MKIPNRVLAAMAFTAGAGLVAMGVTVAVPTSHSDNTVHYQVPAADTVSTTTSPTVALPSPTHSVTVKKRVQSNEVRPLEVTTTSTVPTDPSTSPSPSETVDSPGPSQSPMPTDDTHGPIYTPPPMSPPPTTEPVPTVTPTM